MTRLEQTLYAIAQRKKTVFRRIAESVSGEYPVDAQTGRAFRRIPEIVELQAKYTEQEFTVALKTVAKEILAGREEA